MVDREVIRTTRTVIDLSGFRWPLAIFCGAPALLLLAAVIAQAVIYG